MPGGEAPPVVVVVAEPGTDGGQVEAITEAVEDAADGLRGTDAPGPEAESVEGAVSGIGTVLAPFTGGKSAAIAGLIVAGLRLSREVGRRGKAIVEIDRNPDTASAADQTQTVEADETVRKVMKAGG